MKQNFQLNYFYSENENDIRTLGLVYLDCLSFNYRDSKDGKHKKSILCSGNSDKNIPDQPA